MGESFIGLPNRFKVINNLLESTYNPNHVLSAYQGYRLSVDYVKRSGGLNYAMTGDIYTQSIIPSPDSTPKDIGTTAYKYRNIYANTVYADVSGNASSASKLATPRKIEISGSVTGSVSFDGSSDVTIDTTTNHNHDDLYVKKTGNSPYDPITGPLYVRSLTPTEDILYALGTSAKRFAAVCTESLFATNISGELSGNASSASSLSSKPTVKITLESTTDPSANSGSAVFDGKNPLYITVKAPYLPINGGTLSGNLTITGNITPSINGNINSSGVGVGSNLGDSSHKWLSLHTCNVYADNLSGYLDGTANKAEYLSNPPTIKVVLANSTSPTSNYGSGTFNGHDNLTISVWAPYLPINGGTIQGDIKPSVNSGFNLGSSDLKFGSVYADSFSGNSASATKLATARNIKVCLTNSTNLANNYGSASFNGTGDITIDVSAPYLPINGGTIQGDIKPSVNSGFNLGSSDLKFGSVYADSFSGNSASATKLATARNINGTSFDGSSDITTANWGTARNITIGNSTKSVNGSANVSWSLSEIGAAAASVGTVVAGAYYRGTYVVGTATGYLESGITLSKGTWLLWTHIRYTCGGFRILVGAMAAGEADAVANFNTILSERDGWWKHYIGTSLYTNNSDESKLIYPIFDTCNLQNEEKDYEGKVYEGDNGVGFEIRAIRLA